MNIQRYWMTVEGHLIKHPPGESEPDDFVSAKDYDALAAEATKLNGDLILRISALEAALRKIVRDGDYTAPEGMKRIALEALGSELETKGEQE